MYGQSCPTALYLAAQTFDIKQYGYRTENAGVAMADGAARVSRRISVVTAQNGPAAGLLVAGLAEALKASVPILAIVQEVPLDFADRNAFQELDHERLFGGCAKWIRRIHLADRAAEYVEKAIRVATSGRPGPVVLLISPDVLVQQLEKPSQAPALERQFGEFPADRFIPPVEKIDVLADMLVKAERPLVVAGGGVHLSGACGALAQLQELAQVAVATTNMGKGAIDETHPLSIGVIGNAMGTSSPTKFFKNYVQSADVVVFVGSRTNENGTAGWSLFPTGAQYVQIDVDPEELGRNYPALRLLGDARNTLEMLNMRLKTMRRDGIGKRTEWIAEKFKRARALHAREFFPLETERGNLPLRPETLMRALDRYDEDTIWVADASYSSIWLVQFVRSRKPGSRFITPRGIAGLGWGFPMAIGAKAVRADAQVVCITGDGGFAHCWAELESARRHQVPVVVVVLNNGVLGFQVNAEESRFATHTEVCEFGPIDHVAIAKACLCDGMKVSNLAELDRALNAAAKSVTPFVIDVQVDPKAFPPLTAFESQRSEVVNDAPVKD